MIIADTYIRAGRISAWGVTILTSSSQFRTCVLCRLIGRLDFLFVPLRSALPGMMLLWVKEKVVDCFFNGGCGIVTLFLFLLGSDDILAPPTLLAD